MSIDVRVFGAHVYYALGLAESIEKELLSAFEVVVLELRDPRTDHRGAAGAVGAGVGDAVDGSEDEGAGRDAGRAAQGRCGTRPAAHDHLPQQDRRGPVFLRDAEPDGGAASSPGSGGISG
ncbi:hypothetical protein OHV05_35760 (plasmid) [Kitasatospora sp. NBC_00070]|uniref:hypothetical protein n=1 Tax=Kitasatospora sp. NBC_00070 TaxID=2975962 RepID=UPI003252CD55